jgi:hypothetical protein
LTVVGGAHSGFEAFEASGLAGVGDVMALKELQQIFFENRLRLFQLDFSGAIASELLKDMDVIALGGPDSNWATRLIDNRVPGSFRFGDPDRRIVSITDSISGIHYSPTREHHGEQTDYGIIKRVPSPFGEQRNALVFAGSFGYGTWAGVRLTKQKQFLNHPLVASDQPIECLFRADVVAGDPVNVKAIDVRPLPGQDQLNDRPSVWRRLLPR